MVQCGFRFVLFLCWFFVGSAANGKTPFLFSADTIPCIVDTFTNNIQFSEKFRLKNKNDNNRVYECTLNFPKIPYPIRQPIQNPCKLIIVWVKFLDHFIGNSECTAIYIFGISHSGFAFIHFWFGLHLANIFQLIHTLQFGIDHFISIAYVYNVINFTWIYSLCENPPNKNWNIFHFVWRTKDNTHSLYLLRWILVFFSRRLRVKRHWNIEINTIYEIESLSFIVISIRNWCGSDWKHFSPIFFFIDIYFIFFFLFDLVFIWNSYSQAFCLSFNHKWISM